MYECICQLCECGDPFIISTVNRAVGLEGLKVQRGREVVRDGLAAAHTPLTSTLGGACVLVGK